MSSPTLPGPVGARIQKRLESAAIRFKQVITWEDLRRYILQDPKWDWDEDIVLDWQGAITAHFLECCKACHTDDATIKAFASALEEGQHFKGLEDTNVNEAGDLSEEDSDHGTIRQPKYNEIAKSERIIFVVRWGNKDYDGLSVKHTDGPMSRISSRIVLQRWDLEKETYTTLVGDGATGSMVLVIDLTWELQMQGSEKRSHTTTFEVVADDTMKSDAEFGQNRFDPLCSSRQKKEHSVSKSLSKLETARDEKASKSRSQTGKSSSGTSHRRRTVPSSSVVSGYASKEEFIREQLIAGLRMDAEKQWAKLEQLYLESDVEDDDESFSSSKGKQQSSPNTSVHSKESARKKRGKK